MDIIDKLDEQMDEHPFRTLVLVWGTVSSSTVCRHYRGRWFAPPSRGALMSYEIIAPQSGRVTLDLNWRGCRDSLSTGRPGQRRQPSGCVSTVV